MTIEPEIGDTVYMPGRGETGRATECLEGWVLVEVENGVVTRRAEELVVPSEHGKSRWRRRMWEPDDCEHDESREMAERWASGVVLNGPHGMYGDEVRLDADSGAVMVRSENAIATVIDPDRRKETLAKAVERADT